MKHRYIFLIALGFTLSFNLPIRLYGEAVKVEVVLKDGQWVLLRQGAPYYIKGAGGSGHLDELLAIGGNSIRTWGSENAGEILDKAQEMGLTVMLGLWLQHERHGFDYNDEVAVRKQFDEFREVVLKYKDHPALLLWGVGNEVDLQYTNYNVWYAVEDICKMIHELDPNHPTTTVTAGLHQENVEMIMQRIPDMDIYCINTYGDIGSIRENLTKWGYSGPYIITEWGPNGWWEVSKTKWGTPVEQTSHEKAETYFARYNDYILGDPQHCLGSYVFLWGQKQETTSTWFGLFLKDGAETEVIDYMQKAWTGEWPTDRAPSLDSVFLDHQKPGTDIYLKAGEKYAAQLFASDDHGQTLKVRWEIIPESSDKHSGGDYESAPEPIPGLIIKDAGETMTFRAPPYEGAYRLFVYATDNTGKYAYANLPFYVEPAKEK